MENNNYVEFKKGFNDGILHMEANPLNSTKVSDIIDEAQKNQENNFWYYSGYESGVCHYINQTCGLGEKIDNKTALEDAFNSLNRKDKSL